MFFTSFFRELALTPSTEGHDKIKISYGKVYLLINITIYIDNSKVCVITLCETDFLDIYNLDDKGQL